MERPIKKLTLDDHTVTEGELGQSLVGSEALSNDLIVEEVMRNLPDKEALKRFRFLSRKCADLGFAALAASKGGCEHLKTAVQLTPSMDPKTIDYLRAHGSGIKRVTLDLESFLYSVEGEEGLKLLRELLVERLTGMEHLEVIPEEDKEDDEGIGRRGSYQKVSVASQHVFEKGDVLQNLKSLHITSSSGFGSKLPYRPFSSAQLNFLGQILKVCPNLENITGVDSLLLDALRGAKKMHNVKTVWLWESAANLRSRPTVMAEFVKCKPKLEELEASNGCGGYTSNLLSLLKCSEDSLERLVLNVTAFSLAQSTQQPEAKKTSITLQKLTSITMQTLGGLSLLLGPAQVASALPNLENVINGGHHPRRGGNTPTGESSEVVLKSVKCVQVVLESWSELSQLPFRMFPNLQTVKIALSPESCLRGFRHLDLWCLPSTVEIVELLEFHFKAYTEHGIDALLTGIPRKVYKWLAVRTRSELRGLSPGTYVVLPSVLNLPNLKSLGFRCVDSNLTAVDFLQL